MPTGGLTTDSGIVVQLSAVYLLAVSGSVIFFPSISSSLLSEMTGDLSEYLQPRKPALVVPSELLLMPEPQLTGHQ